MEILVATRVAMSWDFSNSFSSCFLSNELGIKIHSLGYDISRLRCLFHIIKFDQQVFFFYFKRMVDKNRETVGIFLSLNDRNSNRIDDIIEYRSFT